MAKKRIKIFKMMTYIVFSLVCLEVLTGLPQYIRVLKNWRPNQIMSTKEKKFTVLFAGGCVLEGVCDEIRPMIDEYNRNTGQNIRVKNILQPEHTINSMYVLSKSIETYLATESPDIVIFQSTRPDEIWQQASRYAIRSMATMQKRMRLDPLIRIHNALIHLHSYRFIISILNTHASSSNSVIQDIAKDSAFLEREKELKEKIVTYHDDWHTYIILSKLYLDVIDYANALKVLETVTKKFTSQDAHTAVARVYWQAGLYAEAEHILFDILEKEPDSYGTMDELMRLYQRTGEEEKLAQLKNIYGTNPYFQEHDETSPEYCASVEYAKTMHDRYVKEKRWDDLIMYANNMINTYPDSHVRYVYIQSLAIAYMNKGDYQQALTYFTSLYDPVSPTIWNVSRIAECYQVLHDFKQARIFRELACRLKKEKDMILENTRATVSDRLLYYSIVNMVTKQYQKPLICVLAYSENYTMFKKTFRANSKVNVVDTAQVIAEKIQLSGKQNILKFRKPTTEEAEKIANILFDTLQPYLPD